MPILKNFTILEEKFLIFFGDYTKIMLNSSYKPQQDETEGTGIKILTPKQMLQRLPISLAQVNTGNNSESLLNEMRQIVYSLYQSKEITKKVYNNILNRHNEIIKMGTIFMNSENSTTSKTHVLILKSTDKLDLSRGENRITLSNLSIYYMWRNIKSS